MELEKWEQEEFFAHFPSQLSQEIVDYITDVVLLKSRYLFVKRSGSGQQYGYCTHCKKQYKTDNLKHNEVSVCSNCHSKCVVKSSGRGRKYLSDVGYFVWYEKSLKDPHSITARGIYVIRDYSKNYLEVETKFRVTSMYLFEPGQSRMIDRYYWNDTYWKKRKTIISESSTSMQHIPCHCSYDSIVKAVKETPFQYSTWDQYQNGDMLKFFDLAAKYPCVEYLTKLGFSNIVWDKLRSFKTFSVINWHGKNIHKVLKLSKQELKEVRESSLTPTPFRLYLFHLSKKDGSNFSFKEAAEFSNLVNEYDLDVLKAIQQYAKLRKIFKYINQQYKRKNANKRYFGTEAILSTWRDYISDCGKLGMDIRQENVLYPKNIYLAHQNTIKQIKLKEDQELNRKIAQRLKNLEKYKFESIGYFVRPAIDSKELIEEGKALQHCVGTYAKRYADGETSIFVIRKIDQPDKPFYTMEINNGRIIQTRGLRNCLPPKEVKTFIEAFTEEKLIKKKLKQRTANKKESEAVAV